VRVPKFRGDSEDWLDEEAESLRSKKHAGKNKKKIRQAVAISVEETNATVTEVFPNLCKALLDTAKSTPIEFLCSYRRASVFSGVGRQVPEGYRERAPVAVGDRILLKPIDSKKGIVEALALRHNQLSRPLAEREKMLHVLVSNIDLLCIVAATQNPLFVPGIVDRFLIASQSESIPVVLIINKADLQMSTANPGSIPPWQVYKQLGFEVIEVSARTGSGFPFILNRISRKTVAFCGHSGVGKTALMNRLLGEGLGKVGAVNAVTGKGKHTTTGAVLFQGPDASRLIDTPGIKEFGLFGLKAEVLASFFPEFIGLECTSRHCLHQEEQKCQARALPRYKSYQRIIKTL
jgi:ribosome biogenesis GTPase / thiamine phosphate phosphatase